MDTISESKRWFHTIPRWYMLSTLQGEVIETWSNEPRSLSESEMILIELVKIQSISRKPNGGRNSARGHIQVSLILMIYFSICMETSVKVSAYPIDELSGRAMPMRCMLHQNYKSFTWKEKTRYGCCLIEGWNVSSNKSSTLGQNGLILIIKKTCIDE